MRVTVFRGPSVSAADAGRALRDRGFEPDVRGPAAQGDVWDAVRSGAEVVVLVDGVYERVPAVWHKELLAALESGTRVVGTASMGALRAAECAAFGMVGHGSVFDRLVDGTIVSDADVAVAHADADLDHRPLGLALVEVRDTLSALTEDGTVERSLAGRLEAAATDLHFRVRSWPAVAERAEAPPRLAGVLRARHVQTKRDDALATLTGLADILAGTPTAVPGWRLHRSDAWDRAALSAPDPLLLDLLRLEGRMPDLLRAGLLRALATDLVAPVADAVAFGELVAALGGEDRAARWSQMMGLDFAATARFAQAQARLARLWQRHGTAASAYIADQLRVEGSWPHLEEEVARRRDLDVRADREADDEAWRWHVARTGTALSPDDEARRLDFDDVDALLRALRRERALGQTG